MLADELLKLGDELSSAPDRELPFEKRLKRAEPQLLQPPGLAGGRRLVEQVDPRLSAP